MGRKEDSYRQRISIPAALPAPKRGAPRSERSRRTIISTPVVAKTPTSRRSVRSQARRPQASVPPEPLQDYLERSLTRRSRGEPPKPWSRAQPGQVHAPSATPREPEPNARPQRHAPEAWAKRVPPALRPRNEESGGHPAYGVCPQQHAPDTASDDLIEDSTTPERHPSPRSMQQRKIVTTNNIHYFVETIFRCSCHSHPTTL